MFTPDKTYTVKTNKSITETGRKQILQIANVYNDNWEIVTKKGKIAKRIAALYKKQTGSKLTNAQISEIGNLANIHSYNGDTYKVKLSSELENLYDDDNDLVDCGTDTCFSEHGCNRHHFEAMVNDNEFFLVEIFNIENERIGRSFIRKHNTRLIVFNAYGKLSLTAISSLMGTVLDLQYVKAETVHTNIWVNGNSAYILSDKSDNLTVHIMPELMGHTCDNCDEIVDEEEMFYINDRNLCDYCFNDLYFYCENCNEYELVERMRCDDSGNCLCDYCYNDLFTECEKCNCDVKKDDAYEHDYVTYCEDCYHDNVTYCESCQDDILRDEMSIHVDGICSECASEYVECSDCGEHVKDYDIKDGLKYCKTCSPEIEHWQQLAISTKVLL